MVIAIIALLVSILVPSLQHTRKQARGVVCQSKLHQWGMRLATFTVENEGRLWLRSQADLSTADTLGWAREAGYDSWQAETFLAWEGSSVVNGKTIPCSYSAPHAVMPWYIGDSSLDPEVLQRKWASVYVKGAANIPALLDSTKPSDERHCAADPPPWLDGIPFGDTSNHWGAFCVNRHNGSVNSLFLDSSVRKVGLKEFWTLKWQPDFEMRGPWTKAGGVKPQDWPEWMRSFKDY